MQCQWWLDSQPYGQESAFLEISENSRQISVMESISGIHKEQHSRNCFKDRIINVRKLKEGSLR